MLLKWTSLSSHTFIITKYNFTFFFVIALQYPVACWPVANDVTAFVRWRHLYITSIVWPLGDIGLTSSKSNSPIQSVSIAISYITQDTTRMTCVTSLTHQRQEGYRELVLWVLVRALGIPLDHRNDLVGWRMPIRSMVCGNRWRWVQLLEPVRTHPVSHIIDSGRDRRPTRQQLLCHSLVAGEIGQMCTKYELERTYADNYNYGICIRLLGSLCVFVRFYLGLCESLVYISKLVSK